MRKKPFHKPAAVFQNRFFKTTKLFFKTTHRAVFKTRQPFSKPPQWPFSKPRTGGRSQNRSWAPSSFPSPPRPAFTPLAHRNSSISAPRPLNLPARTPLSLAQVISAALPPAPGFLQASRRPQSQNSSSAPPVLRFLGSRAAPLPLAPLPFFVPFQAFSVLFNPFQFF